MDAPFRRLHFTPVGEVKLNNAGATHLAKKRALTEADGVAAERVKHALFSSKIDAFDRSAGSEDNCSYVNPVEGRQARQEPRATRMAPKYIFLTGGVVSSLGKGVAASSIGCLLVSRGFQVTLQK